MSAKNRSFAADLAGAIDTPDDLERVRKVFKSRS